MGSDEEQDSPEELALYQAVARAMKTGRVNLGLSHAAFAELAGMKKSYIIGLERGTANPTLRTILRIAKAIGVNAVELLPGSPHTGFQPEVIESLLRSCSNLRGLIEERKRQQQDIADRELAAVEDITCAIEKLAPLRPLVPQEVSKRSATGPVDVERLRPLGNGLKKSSDTH